MLFIIEKVDYKKTYKDYYIPKSKPEIINIPKILFVSIQGEGNPNGDDFSQAVEALYAFSYAVKMSYKSEKVPVGYYEYIVFPLEGEWDLIDKAKPSTDKDNFKYKIMIRQPDFLNIELFNRFINDIKKKKSNPLFDKLQLEVIEEGLSCQMMHLGSYDDELESFKVMENYCTQNSYIRASKTHREIYLSDPRKTETSKLKTVLRFKVIK